ncbi:fibronectin type 3 and ankyrin repeat domains protein 1-like [Sinocyclocheilus grahami]|uniref:fibronectin type 3 and ankyrin repeat domains protein 1-like n=1 Tax=Sinocyclocheilus grahami TaxID=75366 RepID=UPI0007ACF88C|nr:PREDICTED: fibronectin type 3 and ankyrin repeat domains protein 1-like [Sinocyclocheilus grahami]
MNPGEPFSGKNLHQAVHRADDEELTTVLQSGTDDVDVYDKMGFSPLMVAAQKGFTSLVDILVKHGADINKKDSTGKDSFENVFFLSLWTPLMRVSTISGNAAVASILLQAGADVNVRDKAGKTPLMVAVLNNHVELVKLLLYGGADHHMKNEYGAGAADMAKAFGRQNIINLLDNISLEDSNRLTSTYLSEDKQTPFLRRRSTKVSGQPSSL